MNRRESLKALAIGSAGAATPFIAWENVPHAKAEEGTTNNKEHIQAAANHLSSCAGGNYGTIHLVANKKFLDAVGASLPERFKITARENINQEKLVKALASGEAMVWIGSPEGIPKELSVGNFRVSDSKVAVSLSPATPITLKAAFKDAVCFSTFIAPPKEMPNHNVDEEVRADFLPVLEATDRFGNVVGYPGLVMSYFAPSLAARRFMGSECFFFLFDNPLDAASSQDWNAILTQIDKRRRSVVQVTDFITDFASYRAGERVQIKSRLHNHGPAAVMTILRYFVKAPAENTFRPLIEMRRVPEGGSFTEAISNFRPENTPGLWTIRMQVLQDVEHAQLLAYDGVPEVVDQRDIGFMMIADQISTPEIVQFNGPSILINKEEAFWAGTHYYPSTSWWEWVWRDFRPLKAAEDLAAIRRSGYRIVRVWIDPVIDETVLRAMDSVIQLASENGIVLDICVFTQWVRQMGFERANGEHILFDYRAKHEFNVVSFSLRNLDLQREFVQIIGSRWKNAGNIFYNLANEVYVKDPDATQMDQEAVSWEGIPAANSVVRDSLLFRRWGNEMTEAIRKAGGRQSVFPGYMFSTAGGGDVYVGNADAPVVSWHSYAPNEQTALTLSYFDPISSGRPILLEELGVLGWNSEANYDGTVHYAIGGGAAAAMSYEWGVSWLSRESCYWPLPFRDTIVDNPDPRWFPAYLDFAKAWSEKGVGLCPTPSGTGYGSIYHGTPFPAAAAVALGRMGLMGRGLQRVVAGEPAYVVVPSSNLEAVKPFSELLKGLWSAGVIFGIWQEIDLNNLPETTKAIFCPAPLSEKSLPILKRLQDRGVKVYNGTAAWKNANDLQRVSVTSAEKIETLVRRTKNGRLFTIIGKKGQIELTHQNWSVKMGLSDFAMAHITNAGVVLVEGEGNILINRSEFCTANGRVTVLSEDDTSLLQTKKIRLMVTRPTRISFNKAIASAGISDGFNEMAKPVTGKAISGSELTVDDQLARYVIHVAFR